MDLQQNSECSEQNIYPSLPHFTQVLLAVLVTFRKYDGGTPRLGTGSGIGETWGTPGGYGNDKERTWGTPGGFGVN